MPPEDELSDEVPLSDENEAATSSSDSGVHFATDGGDADVPITGEAPDEDPYAYQDYDGPTEDLANELADDAGDGASYGYDAASETARFDRAEVDPGLLADSVNSPDESDKYRLLTESGDDLGASFAEDAGTAAQAEEAAYEPPAADGPDGDDGDAYASHHPDMDGSSSDDTVVDEGYTAAEPEAAEAVEYEAPAAQGFTVEDEAPAAQGFTVEDEAPAAQGFTVEDEAPAPASKPSRAAAPEPSRDEARPGQVRKSAIDEMFARAAELKRQKGH